MKNQNGIETSDFKKIKERFFDDECHYKRKTDKELEPYFNKVLNMWKLFLIAQNQDLIENDDYYIHKRNLYEVIKRLDKRRTYYYVFHGIEKICEYKEIGILCYWINTLKPFMVVKESSKIYNCPNEMFSLYIIMSTLAKIHKEYYPNDEFLFLEKKVIQDYVYNFKYCDLNREAMIYFVETLAKSYGIGMDKLDKKDLDKRLT